MAAQPAKAVVIAIICGTLLFSVLSWALAPEVKGVVRFLLTCALCYFLYRGKNWARWVLGVLFSLGAAFGVYAIAKIPMRMDATFILGAMAAFYATSSILLLSGKIVGSYFGERAT